MGAACIRKSHSIPIDTTIVITPKKVNITAITTKQNSFNEQPIHLIKKMEKPSRNRPIFNKLSQKILQHKMISRQSINPMQIF